MRDAQREASRLIAIVHRLESAIHRNRVVSCRVVSSGTVAIFQEGNLQVERELDESTLETCARLDRAAQETVEARVAAPDPGP